MRSLAAELLLLRKRSSTWVLLGFWSLVALLFTYVFPYYAYTSGINFHREGTGAVLLTILVPQNFINNVLSTFPFFGGTIVLILGVMLMGSEFTWGTLTPAFTQRDGRLRVFFSKMLSLAIALVPFVLSVFILGFIASSLIAWREGQPIDPPSLWQIVKAMGTSWFILAAWSLFGVLLSVLWRGTALAIGLGIIYGLVLENIISAFGREIDLMRQVSKVLLRTGGYSLLNAMGVSIPGEAGPGGFSGPFLSGTAAALILAGYIILFAGVSALLIRWRDVAGAG